MKRIISYSFFFLGIMTGCEEAKFTPDSFPYVRTYEVSQINEDGATFSASIIPAPGFEITEFGFICEVKYGVAFRQKISEFTSTDKITCRIAFDFLAGNSYTCRAYLKGEGMTILGNTVVFTGKGSEPQIIAVYP